MNDSGYCSSPGLAEQKPNTFFLRKTSSNPEADTVVYEDDEVLGAVASRKAPKMNLNKTLLFAKLRGQDGKKIWVPFTLPCSYIQAETEVEWQEISAQICDYSIHLDDTTLYSKPQRELTNSPGCSIFFIERKHMTAITHVDNKTIGRDVHICVIASPGETFEEALVKDGRFKNVQNFILNQKIEGGKGPKVDINDKSAHFGKVVLQVSVKRPAHSSHSKPSCPTSRESSSTSDVATVEQNVSKLSETKLDELAEKLRRKNVVYIFPESPSKLSDEELLSAMKKCFQARLPGALFRPRDGRVKKSVNSVYELAKVHFAKFNKTGRPVAISKKLYKFFDSVGFIRCGNVEATCFLVSDAMIATNFHVARLVDSQSHSSDALVHFNYEEERGKSSLSNGYKLRPLSYEGNVMSEEFDCAFLFLEVPVEKTLTLGQFVRCKEPEVGNLCMIGHPNGDRKHDDIFPILLLHELNNRLAEKEQQYGNDPSFYMCRSEIRDIHGNTSRLSYDVGCMFEGSSGSPVFDMDFNVVAIHMLGQNLLRHQIVVCRFMEVGVKFKAIIHDLETRGFLDFVKEHFPFCRDEKMET